MCSSPFGEGAGLEANNFLPADNGKFKTLILLDSTLKSEQGMNELLSPFPGTVNNYLVVIMEQ